MRPGLTDTPELRRWIVQQTAAGQAPDRLLKELIDRGLDAEQAVDIMTAALEASLAAARAARAPAAPDSPAVLHVPQPFGHDWPPIIRAEDRDVRVLFSLAQPRVVLFGGLLAEAECDELVLQAKRHLSASNVIDMEHGGEQLHADRTSSGMAFARGATPVIARIERRIAALLKWPLRNGEALQILRYEVGQQYKPHYDYVDPSQPGAGPFLARGGQRVASLVMYLNTPSDGGATNFPDIGLEVAAVKGNALFFSYDRPHPATKTLHGGMPVRAGEKWVATKWLRESAHE
jgi:prolyl 4-hydroxylase